MVSRVIFASASFGPHTYLPGRYVFAQLREIIRLIRVPSDRYIKSQLLLISENRLAQFWVGFNHISFFERVDIDKFLTPN